MSKSQKKESSSSLRRQEIREEFVVEKILDMKKAGSSVKFLIKWEGYDDGHNTWEPKKNLENCTDLVEQFINLRIQEVEQAQSQGAKSESKSQSKSQTKKPKSRPQSKGQSDKKNQTNNKKQTVQKPGRISEVSSRHEQSENKSPVGRGRPPTEKKGSLAPVRNSSSKIHSEERQPSQDKDRKQSLPKVSVRKQSEKALEKSIKKLADLQARSEKPKTGKKQSQVTVEREIEEEGCFTYGDQAERILNGRLLVEEIDGKELLIKWLPRANGDIPQSSWMAYELVRQKEPKLLIDYFEKFSQSQVLFKPVYKGNNQE